MAGTIWGGDQRSPSDQERGALMDADIVDLRRQGVEFAEIGVLMARKYRKPGEDPESPYPKQYMHERWRNALDRVPAKKIEQLRAELNERLEGFLEQVEAVLRRDHYAHSNGRVVELDGQPMLDDGPKLAAIAEARKLLAEVRTLNGATVPVRQELGVDAAVSYTINGVDVGKLT